MTIVLDLIITIYRRDTVLEYYGSPGYRIILGGGGGAAICCRTLDPDWSLLLLRMWGMFHLIISFP